MPRKRPTHVDDPLAAGRRLKEARERAGLSQRELAFPGCSPTYLSRIEAGDRIASPPILRELARRLGVSEEYLSRGGGAALISTADEAELVLRLGEVEEAARLFESALAEARADSERSRALEGLGQIALQTEDLETAVELFEEALSLAGSDLPERPDLAEGLARAYASLGQPARALSILERCLEEYANEPIQYIRFAGLFGSALTDNGSLEEAERVLTTALIRGRELAEPRMRAKAFWSQSRIRRELGDPDLAARFAARTVETLRGAEDTQAIARVLRTLAQVHLERGRPGEALKLVREGRVLVDGSGTAAEVAESRIEEARALAALGQKADAATLVLEVSAALEGAEGVELGRVYASLGELLAQLGESEHARTFLEMAIARLEGHGSGRYLVCAYKRLAELLIREGDAAGALEVLERSLGGRGAASRYKGRVLAPAQVERSSSPD